MTEKIRIREDGKSTIIYKSINKEVLALGENGVSLKSPAFVIWEINSDCNLNCVHCSSSKLDAEMSKDECIRVIDKLGDAGVFWVQISGGEPLLRKDLFVLLKHLKKRNIDTELYTNGILITKDVAKKLKGLEVSVNISLDGIKEYEKVRGEGNFEKVVNGIDNCLNQGIETIIVFVLMKITINDLEDVINFAIKKGIKKIKIIDLMPAGRGKEIYEKEKLSRKELQEAVKILKNNSDRITVIPEVPIFDFEHTCDACKTFFRISPAGEVTPCSFFPTDFSAGNIKERSIKEIWNSKPFKNIRNSCVKGECIKCEIYKECLGGCKVRSYEKYNRFDAPDPRCWRLE